MTVRNRLPIRPDDPDALPEHSWEGRIDDLAELPLAQNHVSENLRFGQVTGLRDVVVADLREVLRLWEASASLISPVVDAAIVSYVEASLKAVQDAFSAAFELLSQTAPSSQEFLDGRNKITDVLLRQLTKAWANRTVIHASLVALDRSHAVAETRAVGMKLAEIERQNTAVGELMTELTALRNTLVDSLDAKGRQQAVASFGNRVREHARAESVWRVLFGLSLALIGGAVFSVLRAGVPDVGSEEAISATVEYVVHNVLLLGGATVLARIVLRRWNLERNLRIIYDHRVAALQQYAIFDASITSAEREAKDQLRLELAKLIFSDPATGYREDTSAELSISPVFNLIEGLASRGRS